MNLRYARTFVTVAEVGTVSKAAARLRIAQPALSRQISAFEQELGLKLFDRVGSRLVLTGEGEQLLSDCRVLLNYASALGERAQLLRRGDTGVLKVAASPQIIESVLADFLHEYARPISQCAGETDRGSRMARDRGNAGTRRNPSRARICFAPFNPETSALPAIRLEAIDLLAACHPSLLSGPGKTIEISRLAPYPLLLLDGSFAFRRNFDAACRLAEFPAERQIRKPDATHPAGDG